jgi:ankyrin repeat protein
MSIRSVLATVLLGFAVCSGAGEIHDAVKAGDTAKVTQLLEATPLLVQEKESNGKTPLHYAALGGGVRIAELLIKKGADIEAEDNDEWTPLHMAALKGEKQVADLLLSKGANLEAMDNTG